MSKTTETKTNNVTIAGNKIDKWLDDYKKYNTYTGLANAVGEIGLIIGNAVSKNQFRLTTDQVSKVPTRSVSMIIPDVSSGMKDDIERAYVRGLVTARESGNNYDALLPQLIRGIGKANQQQALITTDILNKEASMNAQLASQSDQVNSRIEMYNSDADYKRQVQQHQFESIYNTSIAKSVSNLGAILSSIPYNNLKAEIQLEQFRSPTFGPVGGTGTGNPGDAITNPNDANNVSADAVTATFSEMFGRPTFETAFGRYMEPEKKKSPVINQPSISTGSSSGSADAIPAPPPIPNLTPDLATMPAMTFSGARNAALELDKVNIPVPDLDKLLINKVIEDTPEDDILKDDPEDRVIDTGFEEDPAGTNPAPPAPTPPATESTSPNAFPTNMVILNEEDETESGPNPTFGIPAPEEKDITLNRVVVPAIVNRKYNVPPGIFTEDNQYLLSPEETGIENEYNFATMKYEGDSLITNENYQEPLSLTEWVSGLGYQAADTVNNNITPAVTLFSQISQKKDLMDNYKKRFGRDWKTDFFKLNVPKNNLPAGNQYVQYFIPTNAMRSKTDGSALKGFPLKNAVKGFTIHHTGYPYNNENVAAAPSQLANRAISGEASAHALIMADGTRYIMASPEQITFHAGASIYDGEYGANNFTIGIEFQGDTKKHNFTKSQIDSAVEYMLPIMQKYGLTIEDVTTHKAVRKAFIDKYGKKDVRGHPVYPKRDVEDKSYNLLIGGLKNSLNIKND